MKNYIYLTIIFSVRSFSYVEPVNAHEAISYIKSHLESCLSAGALLSKVTGLYGHKPKLAIVSAKNKNFRTAKCDIGDGKISVSNELSLSAMVRATIFELSNLSQKNYFMNLGCSLNKQQYAKSVERIECESSIICDKIISKCQAANSTWAPEAKLYNFKNFQECLLTQEKGGHTENIRQRYEEACNSPKSFEMPKFDFGDFKTADRFEKTENSFSKEWQSSMDSFGKLLKRAKSKRNKKITDSNIP